MKSFVKHNVFFIVIACFTISLQLNAQSGSDSSQFFFPRNKINGITVSSNKHINTLNFRNDLYWQKRFGKINFALEGSYSSAYFFATQKSYRSSHTIKVFSDYSFTRNLAAGLIVKRNSYNDDKRLAISTAEVNQAMFYSKISIPGIIELTPVVGISQNSQAGKVDSGPIYGVEGSITEFGTSDLSYFGRFHFSNEDISPRKNTLRNIYFRINTNTSQLFHNSIFANFSQSRKDFYLPMDSLLSNIFVVENNIESRTESNYNIGDNLQIYFSPRTIMKVGGNILQKYVDRNKRYVSPQLATTSTFDPTVSLLTINVNASFTHKEADYQLFVRGGYNRREETFSVKNIEGANPIFYDLRKAQESNKDNVSRIEYVTSSLRYNLGRKNTLSFSLYQRKLRYDTPGETNFDDRDELLTMLRFGFLRKVSPFFRFDVGIEASQNHLVYIFAERSSNNNIRRILKLIGQGIYRGKRIVSSNSAEVSANYTVYDFDDLTQNYQSFAYRQFLAKDSSSISLGNSLSADIYGYVKLSEQGEFSWKSFSEKPFRYRTEIYSEPSVKLNTNLLNVGLGVRYYSLKTYDYSLLQLFPMSDYTSLGPSLIVTTPFFSAIKLNFHGWYEFIKSDGSSNKKRINFTFSLYWTP